MSMTITKEETNPERHSRKCVICRHKEREEIDQNYLDWKPIAEIVEGYSIPERSLYRHVKALGLEEKKKDNRKRLYLRIMEGANLSDITVVEALNAAKLLELIEGKISTTSVVQQKLPSAEEIRKRSEEMHERLKEAQKVEGELPEDKARVVLGNNLYERVRRMRELFSDCKETPPLKIVDDKK